MPMNTHETIVLALYPNSIGFGYAIVKSPRDPLECGVVKISPISNRKSMERIKKFIDYYEPMVIIVQDLNGKNSFKVKRVKSLIHSITRYATDHHLHVARYSREQIRFVFSEFNAKSKFAIARTICKWLSQFEYRMPRFRKPWMAEDYNMGMFDALSLALTHFYMTE